MFGNYFYPNSFDSSNLQVFAAPVKRDSLTYMITPPCLSPTLSFRLGLLKDSIMRSWVEVVSLNHVSENARISKSYSSAAKVSSLVARL